MKTVFKQDGNNISILDYLTKKFNYYSVPEWKREILEKRILVSSNVISIEYILQFGDIIEFNPENFIEPEVDRNISIVFEDEYLFAVNKPSNLPVHPAGRYRKNNLTNILNEKGFINLYPIHRLDRETSGIILFAKNSNMASLLGKMFMSKNIHKKYIVYVFGDFKTDLMEANGFLYSDINSSIRKKKKFSIYKPNSEQSIECNTSFGIVNIQNGISKLEAIPHTGRIHQIRATLYSLGYPVVGDKIYGMDENRFLRFIETGIAESEDGLSIDRQALHSYSLEFVHPMTGQQLKLIADEPEDMRIIFSS